MNAGAYGGEVTDVLVSAEVVTRDGEVLRLDADDLGFAYRHSDLAVDDIVVRAAFRGVEDDPASCVNVCWMCRQNAKKASRSGLALAVAPSAILKAARRGS